jgi:hypothetical protein
MKLSCLIRGAAVALMAVSALPGSSLWAQHGIGGKVGASLPVVRAGYYTTCVMEAERLVSCWGNAVGDGTFNGLHADPVTPAGLGGVKALAVALGQDAACAIRDTPASDVVCWSSQITAGPSVDRIFAVPGVTQAEQISFGHFTACALITGGTVTCWRMANTMDLMVAPVAGIQNAKELSVGYDHVCVILTDQTVTCWGENAAGQLGIGSVSTGGTFYAPVTVPGIQASQVAAGWRHTCVVNLNQTVSCWGANRSGELGDGKAATMLIEPSPQAVTGLSGAIMVAAGAEFSCALLADRTVRCWGKNTKGSLGDGSTTDSSIPVAVVGLTNATTISAGWDHACASGLGLMRRCWGEGGGGKLTNGSLSDSTTPVP